MGGDLHRYTESIGKLLLTVKSGKSGVLHHSSLAMHTVSTPKLERKCFSFCTFLYSRQKKERREQRKTPSLKRASTKGNWAGESNNRDDKQAGLAALMWTTTEG